MANRLAALRRAELELLANVSHELRTPLARIQLALELVRDGDTERVNEHLDDIAEELLELEQLIDDVMTTTRLDLAQPGGNEGLPPLHRQRVPGHHVLELNVDPVLVRRALDNLIDNAAKFSEADTPVELQAAPSSSGLDITVVDRGMGIGDDDKPRIFEAFYRADKSRTRATGGVGLGLALAKRIVEAHGGSVDFTSQPGSGSRFVVHLP